MRWKITDVTKLQTRKTKREKEKNEKEKKLKEIKIKKECLFNRLTTTMQFFKEEKCKIFEK